jgi:hypothetical protein
MFSIDYNILSTSFDDVERMTEEELRYNFLSGSVVFNSGNCLIDMQWEWIPLLDFSFSLLGISKSLFDKESTSEYFEFTESAEQIEFRRDRHSLKIIPSFSSVTLEITFDEFANEAQAFHRRIVADIKAKIGYDTGNPILQKYLST